MLATKKQYENFRSHNKLYHKQLSGYESKYFLARRMSEKEGAVLLYGEDFERYATKLGRILVVA